MPVISEKRDLVLNVILTVVTAGIFGLFWLYEILTDLESKGGQGKFDKMAHVLLCLIPIVGWILAAQTMAQQWDVIRQRSEREADIILGVVCPVGLLALNVTLSDNFGDGPEPIDPVKAALDAKDPNAQNAQLVQMLQKQQEQMEEMQAKMQHANYQQNQMLKQQNAQMQAQMNAMKKQVEEQKAAQAAAQAKKAADEADIQKRREQIQAEIAGSQLQHHEQDADHVVQHEAQVDPCSRRLPGYSRSSRCRFIRRFCSAGNSRCWIVRRSACT